MAGFGLALPWTASAHHPAATGAFGAPWTTPAANQELEAAAENRWEANVPRPDCGPGSLPETGLQGEVPLADQLSGRSSLGYRCNLELVGQYAGDGGAVMMASYRDCAYMATGYQPASPDYDDKKGVAVIDASNRALPVLSDRLTTPGMINPWEALKVNRRRGLLATGEGGALPLAGPGSAGPHFDIYSVRRDCAHPELLASEKLPDARGHEGDFTLDGRTYYQATLSTAPEPSVVAVDVSHPRRPRQIGAWASPLGTGIHAVQLSPNGNRGYFMNAGDLNDPSSFNGLAIFDTSDIQERKPDPKLRLLGKVGWNDNRLSQIGRFVRIGGHPYVITTDEFGASANPAEACDAGRPPYGYVRIVDVENPRRPRVVSELRLDVNDPANCEATQAEQNAPLSLMYSSHYCTADDPRNTKAIACSWLSSGLRVFDVRRPWQPREIAYYNPGGRADTWQGNTLFFEALVGARTKDAVPSAVRWNRTVDGVELWIMSSLNGMQILRFTNGSYP